MTTRGKFILTILILAVVGFGVYRWWDKIAPAGKSQQASGNFQELKKSLDAPKPSPEKAAADVASKLLAGEKAVSLVDGSAIPPVSGDSRNINDFRMRNGKRRKVVLAQNSPSHYLVMSLLIDAGIDPAQVDFKWAGDAPAAAKIFVQDQSFEAFVGWSPDIYTVSDKVPGTRLVVTTGSANHLIADVWAVRNDFYRDRPDIVANLMRGIFEGMDKVRKDVPAAAQILSKAYNIPVEDCQNMIGKDGGVAEGDAHLTNYRENANFFLDPMNPSNFEIVWNRASTIYKSLGAIDAPVPPAKVKAASILA